jgi:uncharacterized OB-fold protein
MALYICTKCGCAYTPAAACPQCGAEEWVPEEQAAEVYAALNAAADAQPEPT